MNGKGNNSEMGAGDEPVDLRALDPARDAARWQARIDQVVTSAIARRRTAPTTLVRLASCAPFAAAAAIALLVTASILSRGRSASDHATRDPVATFLVSGADSPDALLLALSVRGEQ